MTLPRRNVRKLSERPPFETAAALMRNSSFCAAPAPTGGSGSAAASGPVSAGRVRRPGRFPALHALMAAYEVKGA